MWRGEAFDETAKKSVDIVGRQIVSLANVADGAGRSPLLAFAPEEDDRRLANRGDAPHDGGKLASLPCEGFPLDGDGPGVWDDVVQPAGPKRHGIIARMSRKCDCRDNAVVESFFATLKKELLYR